MEKRAFYSEVLDASDIIMNNNVMDFGPVFLEDYNWLFIMNISRHTYYTKLPSLISAIKWADFIAFDFEFSGLYWNRALINSIVDTYEFRYWKMKQSASKFAPLQIGLTPFY